MPGEEKVWLREIKFTAYLDRNDNNGANGTNGNGNGINTNTNTATTNYVNNEKNGNANANDNNHLQSYDVNEMMELQQTTQPLIGLSDRDINGYKDKISGSSRYASTTSTLADEKLWMNSF